MRVGVLLPNWVGDVAMATPALASPRRIARCANHRLARPYLISLLDGTRWLNTSDPREHKGRGRVARTWQAVRRLDGAFDLLLLLRASFSAGLLARLSAQSGRWATRAAAVAGC